MGAEREAQIGILVVATPVAHIEPTDAAERTLSHHDAGRPAEVHLAAEAKRRSRRATAVPVHVDVAVAGNHRTGLLQRPVEVRLGRHHCAARRVRVEHRQERRQPTGLDERVAVQEAQQRCTGERGALVRGHRKAQVAVVVHHPRADERVTQPITGVVRRGIVHDDELVRLLGVRRDRPQARVDDRPLAISDHDDRHGRRLAGRDRHHQPPSPCRRRRRSRPRWPRWVAGAEEAFVSAAPIAGAARRAASASYRRNAVANRSRSSWSWAASAS